MDQTSESAPPAKRKRESDNASLPQLAATNEAMTGSIQRSPSFWQSKGDIVLQAANTQFRVRRQILEENSPVLTKLLVNNEPSNTVDGCPVLVLEDNKDDIEILLKALYKSKAFSKQELASRPNTTTLDSMLRVANKFRLFTLRQKLTEILKNDLPYFEWCSTREGDCLQLEMVDLEKVDQKFRETLCETVYLAQVHHMRSVFRGAYWMLLACSSKAELIAAFSSLTPQQHSKLQLPEPATALEYREEIRRSVVENSFQWLMDKSIPGSNCEDPLSCTSKKVSLLATLIGSDTDTILELALTPDALDYELPMEEEFCDPCIEYLPAKHAYGQKHLWVDFGVGCLNYQSEYWGKGGWYNDDEDLDDDEIGP
ncbi:hypothetical protein CPB83DRAFT_879819 [Crepidotus variabilis]|uniref:BTB domain-containing protein n=1 Tax=Crepidotus variabilis TaxID=179855 RepID=A0A9P6EQ16_9AGAR|nr:hypothetical protein CPB83DRAFT_879819 [Crepidotus variabilis]